MKHTLKALNTLLKQYGYHLDEKELGRRLFSDPNNPITAISNTLNYFDVKNMVAKVPAIHLDQLPGAFIAQIKQEDALNIAYIHKLSNGELSVHASLGVISLNQLSIEPLWTGLIVAIEKNDQIIQVAQTEKIKMIVVVAAFILGISYMAIATHSFVAAIYLALSFFGLALGYFIFKEKFGLGSIAEKFCSFNEKTDCQSVLNSAGATIFGRLDLDDLTIIYFSFLSLAFLLDPFHQLFIFLAYCSIPMILYSLYCQSVKLEKWCPLCLGVVLVLTLQVVFSFLLQTSPVFLGHSALAFIMILAIAASAWLSLKPLLLLEQDHESASIENLSFRRNYHLFIPYYHSLKAVDTSIAVESDLKIGTPNAILKLIVVFNPVCKACQELHDLCSRLLEKYPEDVQISFRFLAQGDKESTPNQVALRLIQLYKETGAEDFQLAFNDWFAEPNPKSWIPKWGVCDKEDYIEILNQQRKRCLSRGINRTPSILINGKLFPQTYRATDVENFIPKLISYEKQQAAKL